MLHRRPFAALRKAYEEGSLSPVTVAESALRHAGEVNDELNAFALIDPERALSLATESEKRWAKSSPLSALDGMPIGVKESAVVEGWPTPRASLAGSTQAASVSTAFVDRLLRGGALLLGKTRAPEFNWKGVTDSPGFGVTRNPLDPRLTPGGSSGGCAASVAAGVHRVSIGSDAGGSVRIPAAFTGTIALKPSYGRIPMVPPASGFSEMVNTGPIAASVAELAQVMEVVSGAHAGDWSSFGLQPLRLKPDCAARNIRVGLLNPGHWDDSVPEVVNGVQEVTDLLRQDGFHVETVSFDVRQASKLGAFYYMMGCRAAVHSVGESHRHLLDAGLVDFIQPVQGVTVDEIWKKQSLRADLAHQFNAVFDRVDVMVLPTMPIQPFAAGRNVPEGWPSGNWMSWNTYTPAFNLVQAPALSYPIWPKDSPLPVGVQLVATKGRDDLVLSLAAWLESRRPVRLVA